MSLESSSGLGVKNNYGPRETGRGTGVLKTEGIKNELAIEVTGKMLNDGLFAEDFVLPKGSNIIAAYYQTIEAFDLGGTAPTILIGEDGAEVTNGIVISETKAENIGAGVATFAGEWTVASAGIPHDQTVGIALGGTTPTADATIGKMRVVIEYVASNIA